jgi:hypothetical protein
MPRQTRAPSNPSNVSKTKKGKSLRSPAPSLNSLTRTTPEISKGQRFSHIAQGPLRVVGPLLGLGGTERVQELQRVHEAIKKENAGKPKSLLTRTIHGYQRPSIWIMSKLLGPEDPRVKKWREEEEDIAKEKQARKEAKKKTRYTKNNIDLIRNVLQKRIPATETTEKTTALTNALSVQQPKEREREIVTEITKKGITEILKQGLDQGMDEEKQLKNLNLLIKKDANLAALLKENPNISKIIARAILSNPTHPFFNNVPKANVSNVIQ